MSTLSTELRSALKEIAFTLKIPQHKIKFDKWLQAAQRLSDMINNNDMKAVSADV